METHAPDGPSKDAESTAEWFYTQRGETYGPVSSADLRAAAHLRFVGPDDRVRRGERGTWVATRSIRGLFKEAGYARMCSATSNRKATMSGEPDSVKDGTSMIKVLDLNKKP